MTATQQDEEYQLGLAAEDRRLYEWRRDQFVRVGVPWDDAIKLAKDRADIHYVLDLVQKHGCPPELVRDLV